VGCLEQLRKRGHQLSRILAGATRSFSEQLEFSIAAGKRDAAIFATGFDCDYQH
jgi:hypothetical protein